MLFRSFVIDLYLDKDRLANFCDVGLVAPYISAGAVIENISVAAAEEILDGFHDFFCGTFLIRTWPGQLEGVTPFFKRILPYFRVSPVMTAAYADLALS